MLSDLIPEPSNGSRLVVADAQELIAVYDDLDEQRDRARARYATRPGSAERAFADALGCDWMSARGGRQAIPPAYTEHIGRHLLAALALPTAA